MCPALAILTRADDVNGSQACHLPKAAEAVLWEKLRGWSIVTESDLTEHNRVLWKAKHTRVCPGVAAGDYFGTRNPGYAITLIKHEATGTLQTLVMLKPNGHSYELIEIGKPQETSRALVLFKLGPGVFEDIETGEKVKSSRESVAFEDIAAGMLVYTWRNGKFKEIQVSE